MSAPNEVWIKELKSGLALHALRPEQWAQILGDKSEFERYFRTDLVDDLIAAGAILADAYDPARTHIGAQYATAWDAAVAKIKGGQ